jgi:hypothetical protein
MALNNELFVLFKKDLLLQNVEDHDEKEHMEMIEAYTYEKLKNNTYVEKINEREDDKNINMKEEEDIKLKKDKEIRVINTLKVKDHNNKRLKFSSDKKYKKFVKDFIHAMFECKKKDLRIALSSWAYLSHICYSNQLDLYDYLFDYYNQIFKDDDEPRKEY